MELEVEALAEAFAEREAKPPIDPAAEGGMEHELHPPGVVEEALEDDIVERRQQAESGARRGQVADDDVGGDGGAPWASTTLTAPGSIRRMRHDVLPSRNTSPAMLSMAQSSLTVPTT